MLKQKLVTLAAAALALTASSLALAQSETTPEPTENVQTGAYASVNGLELYYETYGTGGEPLILLHGGLGAAEMFAALTPSLAENRQVIVVDLQAHGRTADIDRPISYENMADDVAALVTELGFESVDIMGYSLGGGVALQTAVRHPEIVRKLVLVSTVFRQNGWYPEVLAGMAAMAPEAADFMLETPMYQLYSAVAPRPEDFPLLLGKLGDLLRQDYDWTEQVSVLEQPALIIVGDSDSVIPSHAVEMFNQFGGGLNDAGMNGAPISHLAIIPGALHWDILNHADALLPLILPFLDAPTPEPAA